jgi:DNA-binding MarR family transcriptional regulator
MILPATPFRLERDMLPHLSAALPTLLGASLSTTVRVLREPTMGLIIPDLLAGVWTRGTMLASYSDVSRIEAHIWALLERAGSLHAKEVAGRLHLSTHRAAGALDTLVRRRIVQRSADTPDLLVLRPEARTNQLEIVALEAKLSRWRDAISQAKAYYAFADRSYVVLDGNRVRATETLLATAREAHVGLVLQHGQVLRTLLVAPRGPAAPSAARVLAMAKLATSRGGRAYRHWDHVTDRGTSRAVERAHVSTDIASRSFVATPVSAGCLQSHADIPMQRS